MIGELAGSVLAVGAAHEELLVSGAYPQLVFAGEVPALLTELGSAHRRPAAEIELAASGWEPIGLGAIQDLAQERYGPVDLDRSQVRLDPAAEPTPDCPACAGGRFGFPAELDEQRTGMCVQRAEQAQRIITERLERAPASNRDGGRDRGRVLDAFRADVRATALAAERVGERGGPRSADTVV